MELLIEFFTTRYPNDDAQELADMVAAIHPEGSYKASLKAQYAPEFIAWLVANGHA